VRQLARFLEPGVEGLTRLTFAVPTFEAVGLEEIPAALGQDDGSVLRAERARSNQSLFFEVPDASACAVRVVAQIMQVALRHDPKRADRPQYAAFAAIDLVDAIALANRSALTSARQVDVPGEHVARVAFSVAVALTRTASAAAIPIPGTAAVPSLVRPGVVPVPHDRLLPANGWPPCAPERLLQRMCARATAATHAGLGAQRKSGYEGWPVVVLWKRRRQAVAPRRASGGAVGFRSLL
jgi:hypothetical protein